MQRLHTALAGPDFELLAVSVDAGLDEVDAFRKRLALTFPIALDPENDEAKYNLELALQRARGIQLTEGAGGQNPTPGGSGSSGAGAGDPGSGY